MSFTLEVTFKCLCFFAPEERDGQKRMHVLMPNTAGHAHGPHHDHPPSGDGEADGHGMEEHAVRVVFPKAGGKLALAGPGRLDEVSPGGEGIADFERMEEWRLELGNGGEVDLTLPDALVVVGKVRDDLLTEVNHPKLTSRVLLTEGSVTDMVAPGIWSYKDEERTVAQEIVWSIPDMPGDWLEWQLVRMDGSETKPMPSLEPVDGVVQIAIQHVTSSQFPTPEDDRNPNLNGPHFEAYNEMVDPPGEGHPKFLRKREGRTVYCASGASS
jgi:hypothetical protein